jgi:hypothetical protein
MTFSSDYLCQTWVYCQEESSADTMVYYAQGQPLPPARGREEMTFEATGVFIQRVIAPTCGLEDIPGTWHWHSQEQVVVAISGTAGTMTLSIQALTPQRLCIAAAPGLLYR